jgi:hypothetical protein
VFRPASLRPSQLPRPASATCPPCCHVQPMHLPRALSPVITAERRLFPACSSHSASRHCAQRATASSAAELPMSHHRCCPSELPSSVGNRRSLSRLSPISTAVKAQRLWVAPAIPRPNRRLLEDSACTIYLPGRSTPFLHRPSGWTPASASARNPPPWATYAGENLPVPTLYF